MPSLAASSSVPVSSLFILFQEHPMSDVIYPAVQRLDAALKDNGIPIAGVSGPNDDPPNFTVSYLPEATSEHIAAGNALAADWDVRDYKARPLGVIASALTALSAGDQQIVRDAVQDFVQDSTDRHDSLVKTLLQFSGISTADKNVLRVGTAAALIRQDPRFAVRLGVNVPGDMPIE